jgi:hypothetical protein
MSRLRRRGVVGCLLQQQKQQQHAALVDVDVWRMQMRAVLMS